LYETAQQIRAPNLFTSYTIVPSCI
jgi:hypothetical protein